MTASRSPVARPPVWNSSRRVVEAHEHEAAIVLVHPGLEHARDRERALARHQAGRCHERLRQHEHDLAADADAERIGETLADHDLVAAADERADVPFARDRADARHLALELGLDSAHRDAPEPLARDRERLALDERSRRANVGLPEHARAHRSPIVERLFVDR